MKTINALHDKVAAVKVPGSAHYSYRNWSIKYECPVCAHQGRFNTNFLGRRVVMCIGHTFIKEPKP